MFVENLPELEGVAAASGGVIVVVGGIGVGVKSGGEDEQQLQVVNFDREELLDVDGNGGSKQLY